VASIGCLPISLPKKDRANIDHDELAAFRKLAQAYGRMRDLELACSLSQGDLMELKDGH
jgi:hypothetical protein